MILLLWLRAGFRSFALARETVDDVNSTQPNLHCATILPMALVDNAIIPLVLVYSTIIPMVLVYCAVIPMVLVYKVLQDFDHQQDDIENCPSCP